jgi:hypothetical protein
MRRSKIVAAITALVTAAFAVVLPLRVAADSPHPPGANHVEISVDAPTFTIPDPADYGFDFWVAAYTKAGNNDDKLWDGSLEPGTVLTSREFNDQGNERDISHVDLYGGLNPPPPTEPTTPPTEPTTPPTEPTTPPTQPTTPPTEPTTPPTAPTTPPTQPTTPPTEPTTPPTEPTVPPTNSTVVPVVPTTPGGGSPGQPTVTLAPPLGQMPETGGSTAPLVLVAASLLLAGGAAIFATRPPSKR